MIDSNSIVQNLLSQIDTEVLKAEIARREESIRPKKLNNKDLKKQYYKSRLILISKNIK